MKRNEKKATTFEHTSHRSKHARPSIEKGAVSVCAVHRMNVNEILRVTQINKIIVHFVFLIKNWRKLNAEKKPTSERVKTNIPTKKNRSQFELVYSIFAF